MDKDEALKIDLENLIDRFNEGWREGIEKAHGINK